MRALITGICGFVGPYLAKHLQRNNYSICGTYLDKPCEIKNIKQEQLDITDHKAVFEVVSHTNPDVIFHLAGFSSVQESWKKPELCHKINVGGTKNLLESLAALGTQPRVLLVSSAQVYGKPVKIPIKEDHPLNPLSPYAASRLEMETLASGYSSLRIVISRSFNHIGPGQPLGFVCSDFAHQIARIEKEKHEPLIKVGNLDARRDFTDVRDMVKAYLLAVEKGIPGQTYNLCSSKSWSMQQILDMFLGMSSKKISVKRDAEKMRPSDIPELKGNNTKFVRQTGWKPIINLRQTLKDTLDYWRKKT